MDSRRKRAIGRVGKQLKLVAGARRLLISRVRKNKYVECSSLRRALVIKYGESAHISNSTIYNYLHRERISHKRTSVRTRPTDANKLRAFRETVAEVDHNTIVSLDEASFDTHMVRKYGWSRVGEKCLVIPENGRKRRERHSLMMAVSSGEVVAWQLVEGSFNKLRFLSFLETHLLPAMAVRPHLTRLLMDNVAFHHSKEVRALLDEHDLPDPIIFNPPYHPDTNPVEMVFSVLKNSTRKREPGNGEEIEEAIRDVIALDTFNLPGMFRHALAGSFLNS
jgi:transposase